MPKIYRSIYLDSYSQKHTAQFAWVLLKNYALWRNNERILIVLTTRYIYIDIENSTN